MKVTKRGPRDVYLELNGIALGAYKFRYIAMPEEMMRRFTGVDISAFSTGDPDFQVPPQHSPEVISEMEAAYEAFMEAEYKEDKIVSKKPLGQKLKGKLVEVETDTAHDYDRRMIRHEIDHHKNLSGSCFWFYVNMCLGVKRLLFVHALRHERLDLRLLPLVRRLYDDMFTIKCVICNLEEAFIELIEARRSVPLENLVVEHEKLGTLGIADFKRFYSDPRQLINLVQRSEIDVLSAKSASKYKGWLLTTAFFLSRYRRLLVTIVPFVLRRLMRVAVMREFTWPLIKSLFKRRTEVVDRPVIRTFLKDGSNTALDPAAQYTGEGLCALCLEAHLLRERFTPDVYRTQCWWTYILLLMERTSGSKSIDGSRKARKNYRFLGHFLYGQPNLGLSLFNLDRVVFRVCMELEKKKKFYSLDTIQMVQDEIDTSRCLYSDLTDTQIFTYVKHFCDHGV